MQPLPLGHPPRHPCAHCTMQHCKGSEAQHAVIAFNAVKITIRHWHHAALYRVHTLACSHPFLSLTLPRAAPAPAQGSLAPGLLNTSSL